MHPVLAPLTGLPAFIREDAACLVEVALVGLEDLATAIAFENDSSMLSVKHAGLLSVA